MNRTILPRNRGRLYMTGDLQDRVKKCGCWAAGGKGTNESINAKQFFVIRQTVFSKLGCFQGMTSIVSSIVIVLDKRSRMSTNTSGQGSVLLGRSG